MTRQSTCAFQAQQKMSRICTNRRRHIRLMKTVEKCDLSSLSKHPNRVNSSQMNPCLCCPFLMLPVEKRTILKSKRRCLLRCSLLFGSQMPAGEGEFSSVLFSPMLRLTGQCPHQGRSIPADSLSICLAGTNQDAEKWGCWIHNIVYSRCALTRSCLLPLHLH